MLESASLVADIAPTLESDNKKERSSKKEIYRVDTMPSASDALLADRVESVEFLNELLAHLWPFLNVAASKLIKDIVEPMFMEMLPGPFKGTTFQKIDLGKWELSICTGEPSGTCKY